MLSIKIKPFLLSSLLLFVLISTVLLPNECNAMKSGAHIHARPSSATLIENAKGQNQPAAAVEEIAQKIRLILKSKAMLDRKAKEDSADIVVIDKMVKLFEKMLTEDRKQKMIELFKYALIAEIAFNRFKTVYFNQSAYENDLVPKIVAIFIFVTDVEHLDKFKKENDSGDYSEINFDEKVEETIKIVDKAIKFYELIEREPKAESEVKEEMAKMTTFKTWLNKLAQKIVEPGKEEYRIGREFLNSIRTEPDSEALFRDEAKNAQIAEKGLHKDNHHSKRTAHQSEITKKEEMKSEGLGGPVQNMMSINIKDKQL